MKKFELWEIEHSASVFKPLPTNDNFLDDRYQWQMTTNAVEWPYYRFFYHLSKRLKPKLIVELGGWQGTAAAHFAKGYSDSTVITIDHHSDPGDDNNEYAMMQAVNNCVNLIYLQGWTNDELAESQVGYHTIADRLSVLPRVKQFSQKIDILFIDSWHVYEHAMSDWQAYRPLLNSPALVICDDIQDGEIAGAPISGMMRFWNEMPEPKFLNGNLHPNTMLGFVKI